MVSRLRLFSGVSNRGTHRARNMWQDSTHADFQDANIISDRRIQDRVLFSRNPFALSVFGLPGRCSLTTSASLNSLKQFLTVAIEGEESSYASFKRFFISLWYFHLINHNRITDWHGTFSIPLKFAVTLAFTLCKKLCQIWMKFRNYSFEKMLKIILL